MPYNRDDVVAAVTDYYHFLTSLHIDPTDIKTPPPSGWPDITSESCHRLSQTDAVISLLQHLPYITNEDNFSPTLVWWLSGCSDYTHREFQTGRTGIPTSVDLEDCQWDKLRESKSRAHFVHLAGPAEKYGDYISLDTSDGSIAVWNPWLLPDEDPLLFPSAGECFAYMKQHLIDLKMFPVNKENIWRIKKDDKQGQEVKRLAEKHGWPDQGKFQWKEYLADVEQKRKEWRS